MIHRPGMFAFSLEEIEKKAVEKYGCEFDSLEIYLLMENFANFHGTKDESRFNKVSIYLSDMEEKDPKTF